MFPTHSGRTEIFITEGTVKIMLRNGKGRLFVFVLFFLMITAVITALAEDNGENLLYNGDFEILDKDGIPDGWYTDAYLMDPGYSVYGTTEGIDGNGRAASVHNTAENDARFAQEVEVEPDSIYCLSGYIRAEGVVGGHGANLSVEGVYAFSEKVSDTHGGWKYIEYYGETGPEQYSVTVFARLGGYSGESKGYAAFDNLQLKKVETLPDDEFADFWYKPDDSYYDYEDYDDEWTDESADTSAKPAWPWLAAIGLLYVLIVFAVIYYYRNGERALSDLPYPDSRIIFWPILLAALLLRLVISYFTEGYSVDVNCFVSWGYTLANSGPAQFYQQTGFCDYPPLYTYVLGFNSWLAGFLRADAGLTRVIYRFVPSLCDILGCRIILQFLNEKDERSSYARRIVLLLAFNPVTVLNSAAWGQMDSVLCLLLICVALFAVRGKWIPAIAFYVTAVLVKPHALMLGILGLVFMVLAVLRERSALKKILAGIGTGVVLMVLYVLPFGIGQQPGWLIGRYWETLSSYPYATVNTANLYYLAGGNWSGIASAAKAAAPVILACLCVLHALLLYLRRGGQKFPWTEIAAAGMFALWFAGCAVLNVNWIFTGAAAMAYAFVIVISMAARKGDIRFLPYLGALLFILLYVFGIKMHERYLFPAFLLLAGAWAAMKDRRILYLLLLFSLTVFLNEGIVLDNSIRLGSASGHLNSDTVWLADILSVLNILGALYAVYVGYDLMADRKPRRFKALPHLLPVRKVPHGRNASDYHPDRKLHWTLRDTFLLCCVTLVFSAVSLTTLGSTKAPQTAWSSSGDEEQIVFDLQEVRDDIRVLYFGQVSRNDFTFSQSFDGINWSEEVYAQMDQQQCWKWKYATQAYDDGSGGRTYYNNTEYILHFNCRYVRLTSCQVGLVLNEILFRDSEGNTVPARVVSRTGENEDSALYSDPENLLDEQDTLENLPGFFGTQQEGEAQPSWWNSTYFDEIYHARTGFEFTKGSVPYETSHPPLGKIFISWCITLFGMTPFGWRFAGALAGILMLPGIYLLAKQLTKRTWAAFFACMLMALDCMHLTQTQIATIDSFPVLFIIFSYFFMLRFIQTDISSASMKEILLPLAFSGFFMGLSIASKWIGIYAGIGLAVLYFWHCFRYIRMKGGEQGQDGKEADGCDALRKVFILCLWCVLFFVLVPLLTYLVSYIPYMAYNTRIKGLGDYLSAVWRAQESMFSYHSTPGLGMDHPFYSPWWEWPIIGKPMYYATEQYIPDDAVLHHSIFCFGNPVVWFGSLAAVAVILFLWIRSKHYQIGNTEQRWHLVGLTYDNSYGFVFIGLLAQYLPWVLVPRGTYIYHYFASIPFLILASSMCLTAKNPKAEKILRIAGFAILAATAVFFILLLPYATGMPVSEEWLNIGSDLLHVWY